MFSKKPKNNKSPPVTEYDRDNTGGGWFCAGNKKSSSKKVSAKHKIQPRQLHSTMNHESPKALKESDVVIDQTQITQNQGNTDRNI